jgi:hypothetical protein
LKKVKSYFEGLSSSESNVSLIRDRTSLLSLTSNLRACQQLLGNETLSLEQRQSLFTAFDVHSAMIAKQIEPENLSLALQKQGLKGSSIGTELGHIMAFLQDDQTREKFEEFFDAQESHPGSPTNTKESAPTLLAKESRRRRRVVPGSCRFNQMNKMKLIEQRIA